ncbi:MAG TPA: hypothetical protein VLK66_10820 [Longimicrobium sp.]|nr:hypothetical protein [Longimicrobium sp.]
MRKMKLDPEALVVDSFASVGSTETSGIGEGNAVDGGGTVRTTCVGSCVDTGSPCVAC